MVAVHRELPTQRRLESPAEASAPVSQIVAEAGRLTTACGPLAPSLTRPTTPPVRAVPRAPAAMGAWWGQRLFGSVKGALLGAAAALLATGISTARAAGGEARGTRKELVFVGMNPGAEREANTLKGWSPTGVAFVGPARIQDHALVNGKLVDLAGAPGREAFARALGLSTEKQAKLTALLEKTDRWGRDELARLARVFAEGEHGDRVIERIVLSGHSLGTGIWGDDNGEISWANLAELAEVFPKAARQVEDLAVAACYAGGEAQAQRFKAIFPHLKTFWGYQGSAPGAASGSVWHLKRWEAQTRGPTDTKLDRKAVAGLRKGENVATWSASRGYDDGRAPAPLASLRANYQVTVGMVDRYRTGELEMANPGAGPLRRHYENLQRLLQRADLPAEERPQLDAERQEVIRLIYYRRVAGYFEAEHGATLDRAFESLGLERPDFAKLPRRDALVAITHFDLAAQSQTGLSPVVREAQALLVHGLRDMRAERIPQAWL